MPGMRDAPPLYRTLKKVLPKTLGPYLHLQTEGVENVPDSAPVILASNHLSFLDSLVLPISIPRPVYYLGKADYFDSWRTRWFFEGVGVVPIKRDGSGSGDAALETGVDILEAGEIIGIYPEGTRSPDGRLYRGKTGPVRMALAAGVSVVPCAVIGTDRAQPTGQYRVSRYPVTVRFGRPLDFARYADQATDPFALRSATDELMYEIMMLSGQEYVDEYASKVKSGAVTLDDADASTDPRPDTSGDTVVDLTNDATGSSASSRRAG